MQAREPHRQRAQDVRDEQERLPHHQHPAQGATDDAYGDDRPKQGTHDDVGDGAKSDTRPNVTAQAGSVAI